MDMQRRRIRWERMEKKLNLMDMQRRRIRWGRMDMKNE